MSLWLHRKDLEHRRSLYLLGVPWEILFPILGIIFVLVASLLGYLGVKVF
jgi:hypothetical protein